MCEVIFKFLILPNLFYSNQPYSFKDVIKEIDIFIMSMKEKFCMKIELNGKNIEKN